MSRSILRILAAAAFLVSSVLLFPRSALSQDPSCWFQYTGLCSVITFPGGDKFPVYGCLSFEEPGTPDGANCTPDQS